MMTKGGEGGGGVNQKVTKNYIICEQSLLQECIFKWALFNENFICLSQLYIKHSFVFLTYIFYKFMF